MLKDVFISHSTDDRRSAEEICRLLEERGITCWIAPRDVPPGEHFGTAVIDAIDATSAMVVILSEHANASVHVRNEVDRAVARGKVILPVRIREVVPSRALELFVSPAQWIDAWVPPLEQWIEQLAAAIRLHRLGQTPSKSQVPQAAEEDERTYERGGDGSAGPGIRRELRLISVLACEFVSCAPLGERLSPDDLQDLIGSYQAICENVINRYDAHVEQYRSDGLLVFFGYPVGYENNADRATRAGLEMLRAIHLRNEQVAAGLQISVRIAIHSGEVITGESGGGAQSKRQVLGHAVNVAERMKSIGDVDSVVVSRETLRLIPGLFITEDLGERSFVDLTHPVRAYRVIRSRAVRSRIPYVPEQGLRPLIGRAEELEILFGRFVQAKDGVGQVMLLRGEAGIGKSRLLEALRQRLADEPHTWLEGGCSPYHTVSAFFPLIDLVGQGLDLERETSTDVKIQKLEQALRMTGLPVESHLPAIANFLSLPVPAHYAPPTLSPEAQREQMIQSLMEWLFSVAKLQPVVLVIEDLHWADPSTLDFLARFIDECPTGRVLFIGTYRREFDHPWCSRSHVGQLTLSPLTRRQAAQMVEQTACGATLPETVVSQIVARADGIPLFAEELTRSVLESGLLQFDGQRYSLSSTQPEPPIPETLQDSFMARLDRLGTAKEVAQIAAVLGREFSYEMLRRVSARRTVALSAALSRLVDAELLYRRGTPPHSSYTFKHALIQETAYHSIPKSERLGIHRKIVEVCKRHYPGLIKAEPEWIARHFEEAEDIAQAIFYYQSAAQRALERSSHAEGVDHIKRAMGLLPSIVDQSERNRQELLLQMSLGQHLMAEKGYANPETETAFGRARELCQRAGDAATLALSLSGLSAYHQVRGDLETACSLAKQLFTVAESEPDSANLLWAHLAMGSPLLWRGDPAGALAHLEQAIAHYSGTVSSPARTQDPGVLARAHASLALWLLGRPDRAVTLVNDAAALAREIDHPFSLASALAFAAILHQWRRERSLARQRAEETIELSTRQHFPLWEGMGRLIRGWSAFDERKGEAGEDDFNQALALLASTGTEVGRPQAMGLLADVERRRGHLQAALEITERAREWTEERGIGFWNAELLRLKGEILVASHEDNTAAAELCFRRAIEIAQGQGAKLLELRAAVSLVHLYRRRGDAREAIELLAGVIGGFEEGFDTLDLREAKELFQGPRHAQ